MGFHVMCEVPIGKGEEHLNDSAYRENILARVEPTITRDKNRASVVIWSIGNENPVTDVELEACRRAKELDPTRPICIPKIGSYFEKNYEKIPEFVDIHSPHYPHPGRTLTMTEGRSARKTGTWRSSILTEVIGTRIQVTQETELALLTTPAGQGVALATKAADMAVERDGEKTLLSHNAIISGLGNKGTSPETLLWLLFGQGVK